MRVIDVHNHIFPDDVTAGYREDYFELSGMPFAAEPTIGALLESMKRNGIAKACVLQEWQSSRPFESDNLALMCSSEDYFFYSFHPWLSRVQRENPEVLCFGGVHPGEEDPLGSLETMVEDHQLSGLKLVPCMQQFFLNDPRLLPVYRRADEFGLPLIVHTGFDPIMGMEDYGHPRDAGEVAAAFPDLTVVMAHMGMPFFDETREVMRECGNVYTDLSMAIDFLDLRELCALVREIGPERILFGSDFPFCDTAESLRHMEELEVTSEERKLILGENARRVLNI